jgi:tubulin polyglutamylase TTLL6/13
METTDREQNSYISQGFDQLSLSSISSDGEAEPDVENETLPEESKKVQGRASSTASKSGRPKTQAKDGKKKPKQRVIFNVSETRYDVVKYAGRKLLGFKLSSEPEVEWDILWTDNAVQPETLAKMQPFQKINHFPGMYSLARKNHLGRHLMRMKKAFPKAYKFFPQTYLLPAEYGEFKAQFGKNKKPVTYIIKPEASCQGRGIFLTRNGDEVQPGEHYVAQRYLHKPFLLDGLKFDLRIYVLLAGCDPLRIYLFDDGLGRFATEEYVAPTSNNMDNMCMHLTNYAINKDNPNFIFNESAKADNVGHKRSLKAVMKLLEEKGHDTKALWDEIKKMVIKTFCSVQPILAHSYKSCQPDEPYNNMCFEILGIDIMFDHKLKPWLLEVNHTPSFTTDTPLDRMIKKNVIKDALKIMNISVNNRIKFKNKRKMELQQRVLTGKKIRMTIEERQAASEQAQQERDTWESRHCGAYEKIYPLNDKEGEEDYDEFLKATQKWWEDWTGTSTKRNVKKPPVNDPANNNNINSKTLAMNQTGPVGFQSNQSIRAKEIQNIYSQKLKVGPKNSAYQRTRKPDTAAPTPSSNNKLQQIDEPAQEKVIGEDDRDIVENGYRVSIPDNYDDFEENLGFERKSVAKNFRSFGTTDSTKKVHPSRNSLLTEENSSSTLPMDASKGTSFRIKKTNGATTPTPTKEMIYKLVPSRAEKENPRPYLHEKNSNLAGTSSYKFPTIWTQSGGSKPPRAAVVEKIENDANGEENMLINAYYKPPTKPMMRIAGETVLDEHPVSTSLTNYERKIKTSSGFETTKANSGRNDWYPKNPPKNSNILPIDKERTLKNGAGNFVVPRLFEINVRSSKSGQFKETNFATGVHAGLMSTYGRSLTKGLSAPREASNPSTAFAMVREKHGSSHKSTNSNFDTLVQKNK